MQNEGRGGANSGDHTHRHDVVVHAGGDLVEHPQDAHVVPSLKGRYGSTTAPGPSSMSTCTSSWSKTTSWPWTWTSSAGRSAPSSTSATPGSLVSYAQSSQLLKQARPD